MDQINAGLQVLTSLGLLPYIVAAATIGIGAGLYRKFKHA